MTKQIHTIDRICAWCNTKMGTKKSLFPNATHGMCETCFADMMRDYNPPSTQDSTHPVSSHTQEAVAVSAASFPLFTNPKQTQEQTIDV